VERDQDHPGGLRLRLRAGVPVQGFREGVRSSAGRVRPGALAGPGVSLHRGAGSGSTGRAPAPGGCPDPGPSGDLARPEALAGSGEGGRQAQTGTSNQPRRAPAPAPGGCPGPAVSGDRARPGALAGPGASLHRGAGPGSTGHKVKLGRRRYRCFLRNITLSQQPRLSVPQPCGNGAPHAVNFVFDHDNGLWR